MPIEGTYVDTSSTKVHRISSNPRHSSFPLVESGLEEQCNDRVHRIGQTRPVNIHIPLAVHPGFREHSFGCLLHNLMQRKRKLADLALWAVSDPDSDVGDLHRMILGGASKSDGAPCIAPCRRCFMRDEARFPPLQLMDQFTSVDHTPTAAQQ